MLHADAQAAKNPLAQNGAGGRAHVSALLVHPARHQRIWPKLVTDSVYIGCEQGTHAQPLFSEGDNVTVADGPFAGLEAIYQIGHLLRGAAPEVPSIQ